MFLSGIIFFAMMCLASIGLAQDRITGRSFASRSEVIAGNGMAATSQPLATQVALDVLKQGGSAVDAAIAANATLGLMEPTGNGIGGDLFALVWIDSEKKLYGLNASGRSPGNLTLEELKKRIGSRDRIPALGPLPVSVPGCVDGWFELQRKIWQASNGEGPGPGDRVRSRWLSSFRIDRLLLAAKRPRAQAVPGIFRHVFN